MSDRPPLLTLSGVNTHIGPYHILQGVDLAVPRGALTMLLGRNGAGKTTTLRTIMGLWHASAGSVRFDGADITAWATPDIAQAGIAYVPENMGIFADLTVRENLLLAARSRPDRPSAVALDLRPVSGAGKILVAGGGRPVRRAKADAVDRPRHHRAAQTVFD